MRFKIKIYILILVCLDDVAAPNRPFNESCDSLENMDGDPEFTTRVLPAFARANNEWISAKREDFKVRQP